MSRSSLSNGLARQAMTHAWGGPLTFSAIMPVRAGQRGSSPHGAPGVAQIRRTALPQGREVPAMVTSAGAPAESDHYSRNTHLVPSLSRDGARSCFDKLSMRAGLARRDTDFLIQRRPCSDGRGRSHSSIRSRFAARRSASRARTLCQWLTQEVGSILFLGDDSI